MNDARLTKRAPSVLGLVFFLSGLPCGLNAALAAPPPVPAPPLPVPAPVLIGKIAHIRIIGSVNIPANTIQAVLTQKVGDFYSPAAAEKDRAAIKDMGVFNDPVSVSATSVPSGVDLTYTVSEYPLIKSIRFTADTPTKEPTVPAGTLLALMKTRPGQVLNTKVLVSDLDSLFNHDTGYVRKQGYLFDVSSDLNLDPPTGVLTIPIVEGHIQSIQITGNARVKTADILAQMHAKIGDVYNDNAVQKDLGAIYEMGEFKQVGGTNLNATGPGQIGITIPVVEHEAAQGTLDEKQGKVVPLLYDPVITPFPVIQVSINGKPPLPFIVDTGTNSPLLLNPWAAARLGLKQQPQMGKGNEPTSLPIQSAVFQGTNHANDVPFNINEAYLLDTGFMGEAVQGQRVAGIVGMGMLAPITSRFDFAAKTLTLYAYPHLPLCLPGATVLPLRPTPEGLYTVHVMLAPDTAADLFLDTGNESTVLPLAMMSTLHPTATAYRSGISQIDSMYICPTLRLPGLTLGMLQVPDVVVGTVPSGGRVALGLDLLAGYRMTLDGPNAQLSLEPSATGGRYVRGFSGLDLKQTEAGWSVRELSDVSPARKAGMRVGDEITAVNGRSVQGLSRLQVGMLISGISGRPQRVSLRRGKATQAKTLNVSWTPLDEFSAPRDILDGLTMKKPNGGPWIILNVLPNCPGDRAGLQTGDEITRMDGAFVADMPLDSLLKLMGQASKSITLSVQRAGRAETLSVKLSAPPPPAPFPTRP